MPRSLDHIALMVREPSRTAELLCGVFADAEVRVTDHDTEVRLGGISLVLVAGRPPAERNGDHIAFAVDAAEMAGCRERLQALGVPFQMARGDTALYFDDGECHVFELDLA